MQRFNRRKTLWLMGAAAANGVAAQVIAANRNTAVGAPAVGAGCVFLVTAAGCAGQGTRRGLPGAEWISPGSRRQGRTARNQARDVGLA